MVGFGFALVPLYDLFCEVTGLGWQDRWAICLRSGNRANRHESADQGELHHQHQSMVCPGSSGRKRWCARAPGRAQGSRASMSRTPPIRRMVGQAIPSLVPVSARTSIFTRPNASASISQVLQPGEEMAMPMRFIVGRELPANVQSITLSYAFFDVTDSVGAGAIEPAG